MSIQLKLVPPKAVSTLIDAFAIPVALLAGWSLAFIPPIVIFQGLGYLVDLSLSSRDSRVRYRQNFQNLQASNTRTAPVINDFAEVPKTLAVVHDHFATTLENNEELLTNHINVTLPMQETEIQALITAQQGIDFPEFESTIECFMAELANMQAIHRDDILDYAQIIPEMQRAEEQLKMAQDHLQEAKQELAKNNKQLKTAEGQLQEANQELDENIQEYNELRRSIQESDLQRRNEALRLQQKAETLIEKGNPSSHQIHQGAFHGF